MTGAFTVALLSCSSPETVAAPAPIVPVEAPSPPPPAPAEAPLTPRDPPAGFVHLVDVVPDVCLQVGYHRDDNFTGAQLPGYGAPGAWMLEQPAKALVGVAADVKSAGYVLVIFDAYRPYRGTRAMVAWALRTGQGHLLEDGYIARRSGHNHGHTVDLGLALPGSCELVDMGTPWDTLDERSHTRNAEGEVLARRLLLKDAMQKAGFSSYWKEWWHFGYTLEGTKPRDVPYGRDEPDEGAWIEPDGWDQPAK